MKGQKIVIPLGQWGITCWNLFMQGIWEWKNPWKEHVIWYFGLEFPLISPSLCWSVLYVWSIEAPIPKNLWCLTLSPIVGTDLFTWNQKDFIVVADYYSKAVVGGPAGPVSAGPLFWLSMLSTVPLFFFFSLFCCVYLWHCLIALSKVPHLMPVLLYNYQ